MRDFFDKRFEGMKGMKEKRVFTILTVFFVVVFFPFITGSVFVFFAIAKKIDSLLGMINFYPATYAIIYFFGFGILFLLYAGFVLAEKYKERRSVVFIKESKSEKKR